MPPMPFLPYIAWPLLALAGVGLVLWLVVLVRVARMRLTQSSMRAGLDGPGESAGASPSVSIVIPAHNEEAVVDACVRSLRAQDYEPIEIIFVLDRCTDATLATLQRHADADRRVVLIENETCPDDWAGKCHAARLGAERATGDYLLFADADTRFAPDLVRAAVTLARRRDLALLSILSTLTYGHRFERVAQPVASMSLIGMFPVERVNRREGARPFANGQFMLFARSWYERIGGHASVKGDLLEDIAFARRIDDAGGAGGIFFADGMLTCAMYDSLAELKTGWKRIFIEACKRKPSRLRKNGLRTFAGGVVLPAAQLGALVAGVVALLTGDVAIGAALVATVGAGWLAQFAALAQIYRLSGAPASAAVFYPIGAWIVAGIMMDGASDLVNRRAIPWAGRSYVLEPR